MRVADIWGGLVGILIGAYVVWEGSNMPPDLVMKIGPSFFPNILAGLLILFSVVLLVNALRGKSKGTLEPLRLSSKGTQRGLVTLAATIVFCAVLESLGFILTAIIFLMFMMVLMGKRKPLPILLVPPLITFFVWLVFEKVLFLSLPAGVLADIL